MTNQEAFNRVWEHFIIEKNQKSVAETGKICFYYDEVTGNRCAIGCLFPEDIARKVQQAYGSMNIYSLLWRSPFSIGKYLYGIDEDLLIALQVAHDRYFESLKEELIDIANIYSLTIPTEEVK